MTLPAFRFEARKKKDKQHTWVFDYDETITAAPKRLARIATGLRSMGDRVIVLTGNTSPRKELLERLENDYGFPFDELIQYEDDASGGIRRAEYLKQLDAWGAFDDRAARAYTLVDVCPQFFVASKPSKQDKENADEAKPAAKKATKGLRSAAPPPPNYRPADAPGESCGNCLMNDNGLCWGYGNARIAADHVCDSWHEEDDDD